MYSAEWVACGEVIPWGMNADMDGVAYYQCIECQEVSKTPQIKGSAAGLKCTIQGGKNEKRDY